MSRSYDFLRHEPLRSQRGLMIEQNSRASKNAVAFSIIRNLTESCSLRCRIPTPRAERCLFICRLIAKITKTLAGAGVIHLEGLARKSNGFQQIQCGQVNTFLCFDRLLK